MEKAYIEKFVNDEKMFEEVKQTVLEAIALRHIQLNTEKNNEDLGAEVRATLQAEYMIREVFKDLLKYQTPKKVEPKENPAR